MEIKNPIKRILEKEYCKILIPLARPNCLKRENIDLYLDKVEAVTEDKAIRIASMGIELLLTDPNSSCNWNASWETSTDLALGVKELGEETVEPLELLGPEHELEPGLEEVKKTVATASYIDK